MKNKLLSELLIQIVKQIVGHRVMEETLDVVKAYMAVDISGEEKRAAVKRELLEAKRAAGNAAQSVADFTINLAIEAAVAWIKARQ